VGRATVELGFYWGQGGGLNVNLGSLLGIQSLVSTVGVLDLALALLGFCIDTGPYGEDSRAQTYISECV
jgi:hypothetical protein